MVSNENMKVLTKQILIVASLHTIIFAICIYAYQKAYLLYDITVRLPFLFLFCLVPIIISFVLLTRHVRLGAVILLGILPAALINNIISRFTGLPALVPQDSALFWRVLYEGTFGLVLVSEVVGTWLTLKLILEIHKIIDSPIRYSGIEAIETKGLRSKSSPKKAVRKKKRH
jgi:hypothetical protein